MAELLQEGFALLVSLALGISLLTLLHPGVTSIGKILTDEGGATILNDIKNLLEDYKGYSIRLLIGKGINGWYRDGVLTVNSFGKSFSMKVDLGPYEFQIYDNCVLESDGVGWRDVG